MNHTVAKTIPDASSATYPKSRVFALLLSIGLLAFAQSAMGQCVPHPDNRTAVQFQNESSYELTFFVDNDEKGVAVPPKSGSPEQPVEPGEHMFRARAIVADTAVWVWMINEVGRGQLCTWTVTDPEKLNRIRSNIRERR